MGWPNPEEIREAVFFSEEHPQIPLRDVAERFGVSMTTLVNYRKKLGLPPKVNPRRYAACTRRSGRDIEDDPLLLERFLALYGSGAPLRKIEQILDMIPGEASALRDRRHLPFRGRNARHFEWRRKCRESGRILPSPRDEEGQKRLVRRVRWLIRRAGPHITSVVPKGFVFPDGRWKGQTAEDVPDPYHAFLSYFESVLSPLAEDVSVTSLEDLFGYVEQGGTIGERATQLLEWYEWKFLSPFPEHERNLAVVDPHSLSFERPQPDTAKCLESIRDLVEELKRRPTIQEVEALGISTVKLMAEHGGSWAEVLDAAGLPRKHGGGRPTRWTKESILTEIRRQARELGRIPTLGEFIRNGGPSKTTVRRLGGWTALVEELS